MGDSAQAVGRRLLEGAGIRLGGDAPWDLHVHDDRFWERVIGERELGLGESYMDGWWSVGSMDQFLAKAMTADLRKYLKVSPRQAVGIASKAVLNHQRVRRAARNAGHHYNIGNDLYSRMLDKRMIYSCAYWANAVDLDAAQENKLDLICRKLHLEPGMKVLDIGCGWGGLAEFMASRYGAHVVGISPAIEQVRVARERCRDLPVEIRQEDYRNVTGTFDRIVSVGMFEHVGPKNYPAFFAACDRLLSPDGIMLHHTIGSNRSVNTVNPFFEKYIFPGGVLPSVTQVAKATERTWLIEDLHNFGPDYDRTLMAWHANATAAWPELPAYDERFRRMWDFYLLSSAASFRVRSIQLWQFVFRRTMRPSPTFVTAR